MALNKEDKKDIFLTYSAKNVAQDTGSPESQIALFSNRITYLTEHLKQYPKDKASRLGLIKLVGKRKKQLTYLQNTAIERYRDIIVKLGIRK
ncbi:ribosomal protein S15 [Candidatus Amoebophilus asiaticus 5a2]|uniref:Small ribosomal subunit protein uS15 n=1 Tax=Amoebophilus asiaticus (strain 5a2) TaxID=452471 RepID=RS15_AMOA5|nr:30S ribosomal protein S15 [Candidatus Amoebophilus asiaticus]B3EU50.1 RecName: Full=Small ribosomal subunit protein uS15; AltName: Full=30S ribosomal protein S15 [Candidatus Amoebophilus asiaticus 5a2]ACE05469.1 ribosomal protein S15 [Candidatus Amoebophilus asiaticus 5a2]